MTTSSKQSSYTRGGTKKAALSLLSLSTSTSTLQLPLPSPISLSSSSSLLPLVLIVLLFFTQCITTTTSFCTGELRTKDIAGIWRLTSKNSFLPKINNKIYPLKEFTVYPKKQPKNNDSDSSSSGNANVRDDILLLLREDGKFVQYSSPQVGSSSSSSSSSSKSKSKSNQRGGRGGEKQQKSNDRSPILASIEMKGSWGLVDGKLILAADRPNGSELDLYGNKNSRRDTILEGRVVAVSDESLVDNPALQQQQQQQKGAKDETVKGGDKNSPKNDSTTASQNQDQNQKQNQNQSRTTTTKEDVHLSVPKGKVKIGKFFYPQNHPSFFEQPMFDSTSTGSFELRQVLGNLNTQLNNDDEKLVEKFRKKDLMDKRYFITSYPLPNTRNRRKRWSIKYNKFVDAKPKTDEQKEWEEKQKNAPIPIKTFEVDLFANNTFQTVTGLGDTILRGKWSIVGDMRDQLWMKVWRFGFGRAVSGSTYSEGSTLSQQDDVAYWGKIYEVDVAQSEDKIDDDPLNWKGTKIEINGSVMLGVGLEPCSIARFTMIEKTEDDYYDDDEEDDDDEDDIDDDYDDLPDLRDDIGSFE
mmetsp:Transcript_13918/g.21151  ORF Transcript_13918/g.21151 Transcript_13918/m.21151 type:complete len:582 (+) Transcript_13918:314-2059(+)